MADLKTQLTKKECEIEVVTGERGAAIKAYERIEDDLTVAKEEHAGCGDKIAKIQVDLEEERNTAKIVAREDLKELTTLR